MKTDFRALAHLQEELGEERWQALISSDNTGKVKKFCDELLKPPTEISVGACVYDILSWDGSPHGEGVVAWVNETGVNLGEKEGLYVLTHQDGIPVCFRGKVTFVFTDWKHRDPDGRIAGVYGITWDNRRECWIEKWYLLADRWPGSAFKALRRKPTGTAPVGFIR